MKKLLGLLAVALCLIGCGKESDKAAEQARGNGPGDRALVVCEAMRDGDFDKAAKYATADMKSIIDEADPVQKKMMQEMFKGGEFKVLETKVDGDTATVKMELKKDGKAKSDDIRLVKEDGEWKVDK